MRYQIENNGSWIIKLYDILERVKHDANLIEMVLINLGALEIKVEDNWHQTWGYMADDKPKLRMYRKWKQ